MRHLLPVAALLFFTLSYGQDGEDFLITLKSDTIKGEIRILSYDLMDRVQFIEGKKKTTFTALQVRNVSIDNELYAPVKYDNAIRMMKIIRSGFLSLYAFRYNNQVNYDGRLFVKMGSSPLEVPNLGFKKFVGGIVEDCPEVAGKVKGGEFDRGSVEDLVDQYNKCVSNIQDARLESAKGSPNPTTELIEQLRTKVNASDLAAKNEVSDLLNSIADKVRKNEPVPSYMKEGLKGYLSQREDFKEDTGQLLLLLEK